MGLLWTSATHSSWGEKTKGHAVVQGKFNTVIDVKVLLWSCFFVDTLSTAKQFSLKTQKANANIISTVDNKESTKNSYEELLRKFESNADKVFSLPTLKSVIKEIESKKDGEPVCKGQKLKCYSREI